MDNLTEEQRSHCMAQNKGKDTSIELKVRSELHRRGLRFRKHIKELPGNPDIVFPAQKVVVFIDGDFWHGYRFPTWEDKVSEFWKEKIRKNRERDKKNHGKLYRMGWQVIRIWEHEIEDDLDSCIEKIISAVNN